MTADSRASGAGPAPDDRLARAVLAASQDCVKTLALDGSLLSINAAGCSALEIDEPAAVLGGSWVDFWRGPDREAAQKALEAATAGSVGQFQGCCPTTSGVVKWWDVIVNAAADETGAPAFLLAVSRDITRQKQDESLADGQRRALELLARGASLAETLTVLAETIEANARAASVSILVRDNGCLRQGASPSLPDHYVKAIDGLTIADVGTCLAAAHRNETVVTTDIATAESWAAFRHLPLALGLRAAWSRPIRSSTGEVVGTCGTYFRDSRPPTDHEREVVDQVAPTIAVAIERSRAEAELVRSREQLQDEVRMTDTLNRVGEVVAAELDREQVAQTVTEAATALTGAQFGAFFYNVVSEAGEAYQLYTLSGAPKESFAKFPLPRATQVFAPTFQGKGPVRIADVTVDHRYGKNAPYAGMPAGHLPVRSYLAVPVKTRTGEVLGGLFFGHPRPNVFSERHERLAAGISAWAAVAFENARLYREARVALDEARNANRLKDEFLAVVSHELRTPLNAMFGWSRMLKSEALDEPSRHRGLEAIERNARLQTQLIEDLLDVSRIVTGNLRLQLDRVDLAGLVEVAVETVRPNARAKRVSINLDLQPGAAPVTGDAARLQQVVANLLTNAVKFTPEGGRVQVELRHDRTAAEIAVTDTGVGIEPAFLPHVFDRFRQADSSATRKHGGLGLGLAIVRYLTEAHGGEVRVDSEGADRGARFSVRLPVLRDSQTALAAAASDGAVYRLDSFELLVVDDDPDSRELMATILASRGAAVRVAASAADALHALHRFRPHAVIADVAMPEQDGYDFLRALRARPPDQGGDIPVIAVTAYAGVDQAATARAAGFNDHLSKPIDSDRLARAICQQLSGRSVP